jgi:predicted signal transduction protein with EAL and GGDEF domain
MSSPVSAGDEFAVLQLAIAGPQQSSALADRIIKALSEPNDIEGQQIVTGVSIGIAVAPADGETSEQLLKNAQPRWLASKKISSDRVAPRRHANRRDSPRVAVGFMAASLQEGGLSYPPWVQPDCSIMKLANGLGHLF